MGRIIPVVVEPETTLDTTKRYWRLGLFNPDGSPFSGGEGTVGPEGPEGPQGPQGPAGADGADGADGSGATYVTELPASPTDGQEIMYAADPTNGILWHLRYRAGSASAYKWEWAGGSELFHEVPTQQSTGSTSYVDLATVGPSITVPLAGDYQVVYGAGGVAPGSNYWIFSLKIGAATAVDNDEGVYDSSGAAPSNERKLERTDRLLAVPASTVLKLQYRVSGGTGNFRDRRLFVRPIRVG